MKQSIVLIAAAVVLGASASEWDEYAALRARFFDTQHTTTNTKVTNTQQSGASTGGKGRGGQTGRSGPAKGSTGGHQFNKGANGGSIGTQNTNNGGAQMGQSTGSSQGGDSRGSTYNQAAPFMFGGGMYDKIGSGNTFSGPSIGSIGQSNSGISGSSNSVSTGNSNNANGGSQGGTQSTSGSGFSKSGNAGGGVGGAGGATGWGGGFSQGVKGGDATSSNSNSASLSLPLPIPRRSLEFLERRALELEDEYMWVTQQKRDLEQSLYEREAEPEEDAEDMFQGLTARDIAEYYYLLASDY